MKLQESIELRSDEVEGIISHMPNLLIRWGLTLLFSILMLFIGISWLIKYPDIISADVIISTQPSPIQLVARNSGKLMLFKSEGMVIKKGELIACIQSDVSLGAVSRITTDVNNKTLSKQELLTSLRSQSDVGSLQPYLNSLISSLQDLVSFQQNDLNQKQCDQIKRQISSIQALNSNLTKQLFLQSREVQISHQQYQTDSLLFSQGVISSLEHKKSESTHLNQQRNLLNTQSQLLNNQLQIEVLEKNITELETERSTKKNQLDILFNNSLNQLMASIQTWEKDFLFLSPISGKISFLGFLENEMFIQSGNAIITVAPDSDKIIARAELPLAGAGKVNIGQTANLRLDNYPYEQFGFLEGKVLSISQLPNKENYQVLICLSHGMNSSYNKELPFKPEMKGKTEIITSDLRLLERILYQFRILF
jgi:hypothetical protein